MKPGLKIKFAGSNLAPGKGVHLLGSWDTARRAGHGQCVSRIQCGAPGSLFYTHQAPAEIRDRCWVGKLSIMGCSVLTGAISHRAVQFSRWKCLIPGWLWTDTAPVQPVQFVMDFTAETASAHAEGLRDLFNFHCDIGTKQTHKSDEAGSRSV